MVFKYKLQYQSVLVCIIVQLWTMSNYHWYLKMELNFTNAAKEVAAVSWDPVSQLKLHIVTRGQCILY